MPGKSLAIRDLRCWWILSTSGLLITVALVLWLRSLVLAPAAAPPGMAVWAMAAVAIAAILLSLSWPAVEKGWQRFAPLVAIPGMCLMFALLGVSRTDRREADMAVATLAAGAMGWSTWYLLRKPASLGQISEISQRVPVHVSFEPTNQDLPLQQTQRRWTDPKGHDIVHGSCWLTFRPDQRQETAHIAFCPPFTKVPAMSVECVRGEEASVTVAQALWHGATLEVRLNRPARHAQCVEIEYHAEA